MNSLGPLVYLVAAGVYLVLRRQSKAHRREIALEYIRLGTPPPPARPKVEMLEALLTTTIGLMMTGFAGSMIVTFLGDDVVRKILDPGLVVWLAVLIAGGLTLIILGSRAIRDNMRRQDRAPGSAGSSPAHSHIPQ